jgi:chromosome partitioning protein
MRSVLILNAKGGCGKSTLATNLAGYYASKGRRVVLADFDPQQSALDWLSARPVERPGITGIAAWRDAFRVPKDADWVIIDSPAAIKGRELSGLVRRADSILMPLLPSAMDVRAANHFIGDLNAVRKVVNREVRVATVANRVREHTLAAAELEDYLARFSLPNGRPFPFLAALRATQNYVWAAERGLSIFEFAPVKTLPDREQWVRILRWLSRSGRSRGMQKPG